MYFNLEEYIDISKLLNDKYSFYAHLDDFRKDSDKVGKIKKETLKEHTDLCREYFDKLIKLKNIDEAFLNFENYYFKELSEDGKNLFRNLIINTIAMHDIGKINPYFQIKKMDNSEIRPIENFNVVKTKHSILSAVLYIDYFIDKILSLEKSDRDALLPFLFFNGYIISKHHSDLDDFYGFLNKFDEDEIGFKIIELFSNSYKEVYIKGFSLGKNQAVKVCKYIKTYITRVGKEEAVYLYTYERLLYSLLVACDFYATTEFMGDVKLDEFGELGRIDEFYDVYKNTEVYKSIRKYEDEEYYKDNKDLLNEKNINILRNEMFLDAEKELIKSKEEDIFFLEAPTGSGKSNVSMNLSFKLVEENKALKKIFYVYPFNTLVEQNLKTLKKVFENNEDIFYKIAVINSISPIKMDEDRKKDSNNEDSYEYYAEALLNRQFLNYPMILTTHVSLFDTMFNASKESAFGFHQLANSVLVLDEIQSYKNIIWTEIISFLKGFSKILNMKVIIMSATLPELNLLIDGNENTANLIVNREKYFSNSLFKNRVEVNYDLIGIDNITNELYEHVKNNSLKNKKILIEFIKKESAYNFFRQLNEDVDINVRVELMTGDDNIIERERILDIISSKEVKENGIILVATQVIEAGVDIDMDIGYKDISKLDSDEQFMGRINRGCKDQGIVYFFNLDKAEGIYKNDIRINTEFSLVDEKMREILKNKDFSRYYAPVLELIKSIFNDSFSDSNLKKFFIEKVGGLNFKAVEERMKLIEEDNWSMSIYLCRVLKKNDGTNIDGEEIWKRYKKLLKDNLMEYSRKQVELSNVTSQMNNFIYQIKKNNSFVYDDKIGEIYCIKDGEVYFEDGKLNKDKFISQVGVFI